MTKRDYTISFLRVLSMFMIIICHTVKNYSFIPTSEKLGPIFGLGVEMFLLISGFLYGTKEIANYKKQFKKSYFKIWLPAFAVALFWFVIVKTVKYYNISDLTILVYLFNIQGLGWIHPILTPPQIVEVSHLWFLSVIILCYLLIPILQKHKDFLIKNYLYIFAALYVLSIVCGIFEFRFAYFAIFITGYMLGARKSANLKLFSDNKAVKVFTAFCIFILSAFIFVIGNRYFHETAFYIYSCWLILGFGLAIFGYIFTDTVFFLYSQCTKKVIGSKAFTFVDKMSFYVYLVHSAFCKSDVSVYKAVDNLLFATFLFIALTAVSALILYYLDSKIQKLTVKNI